MVVMELNLVLIIVVLNQLVHVVVMAITQLILATVDDTLNHARTTCSHSAEVLIDPNFQTFESYYNYNSE